MNPTDVKKAEVEEYDGDKRCYFHVWLRDKVTELCTSSEEKYEEQKQGTVIVGYIDQEVEAISREVDALLSLARQEGADAVVKIIDDEANLCKCVAWTCTGVCPDVHKATRTAAENVNKPKQGV